MNIIFLDVDGVLNSINKLIEVYNKTKKPHSCSNYPFDENCLSNLKTLVNATNAKLVITSVWRKKQKSIEVLMEHLKEYGLDKDVIGYTDILNTKREIEIKAYLNNLDIPVNFIILDDDSDMGELLPYLIKTNIQVGLTSEDALKGIKLLKKK